MDQDRPIDPNRSVQNWLDRIGLRIQLLKLALYILSGQMFVSVLVFFEWLDFLR